MTLATRRTALFTFAAAAAAPVLLSARGAAAQQTTAAEYVTRTLEVGMLALMSSQAALEKAQDERVREFAMLEIAEQQAVAQVLAWSNTPAPTELPPERAAMLEQLQMMEAGPGFDMAYVDMQLQGHMELLQIQQTLSGGTEPSVEGITAKLAEQAVTSHIAMLNHMRGEMGDA